MTERQKKTLEKMHPDRWYTARSLETNELSLDGLRKKSYRPAGRGKSNRIIHGIKGAIT